MYRITTNDIKAYLGTLEPDEEAGRVGSPEACLVANALKHKYGEPFMVGATCFWAKQGNSGTIPITTEIGHIVGEFDSHSTLPDACSVTRSQVETAIPELR